MEKRFINKSYVLLCMWLSLMTLVGLGLINCQNLAQQHTALNETKAVKADNLQERLPVDQAVTVKKLSNGLTYYVRANSEPRNTIELRLVVNAGSVLEADGEQGLAHFVEHMAFDGTEHFKKNEIVNYLESLGIRYGPELNAHTGFDETVYQLQVPANNEKALHLALQILLDWAHAVTFDEEALNNERKVVIDEWRTRQSAEQRILEQHYPVLFKDSAYATRMPIGQMSVIEKATREQLRQFYHKWYRPELMAVIVVGDFSDNETGKAQADPAKKDAGQSAAEAVKSFKPAKADVEKLISNYFSSLPASKQPVPRPVITVPDHKQTLYAINSDKELTETQIGIYVKDAVKPFVTWGDYRSRLLWYLYTEMLNSRLDERTKNPDPPFTKANTGRFNLVRSKAITYLGGTVPENGAIRGLKAILTEVGNAQAYGFNSSELDRAKAELISWIENAYLEREKTPSDSHVEEYINNYLEGDPIPGVAYEYKLFKACVPGITLDEVNALAKTWLGPENRVVLVSVPDKQGLAKPGEEELAKVFVDMQTAQYNPYEDTNKDEPLLTTVPVAGSVVKETVYEKIGFTHWELSNGVQVWVKPTNYKNNEIVFEAFSPGGHSLFKDKDYIPAITAASIVRDSGLGNFTKVELDKRLAGMKVNLETYIDELFEGMTGGAVPKDLEALFQMIYLRFLPPKANEQSYAAYCDRLRARFVNRASDPENVFWDTLHSMLGQDNIRYRPITPELLKQMSLTESLAIYKDRFADASDFTFVFVGSFDLPAIKKYALTYLANLPSLKRQENFVDLKIEPPAGIVKKTVSFGKSPDGRLALVFHGKFNYSEQTDYYLQAISEILQTRLREKIREEEGGTYSIGVFPVIQKQPEAQYEIYIGFSCDPKRIDELNKAVFTEIDWLKTGNIDPSYLSKFKEMEKRTFEKNERENSFWLEQLATSLRRQEEPDRILSEEEWLTKLTMADVQATARTYLSTKQYVQLILYPEIDSAIKNNSGTKN